METILVYDHTLHDLRVGYAAAYFLFYCNVIGVHRSVLIHNRLDSSYGNIGQLLPGGLRAFAGHGGDGDVS